MDLKAMLAQMKSTAEQLRKIEVNLGPHGSDPTLRAKLQAAAAQLKQQGEAIQAALKASREESARKGEGQVAAARQTLERTVHDRMQRKAKIDLLHAERRAKREAAAAPAKPTPSPTKQRSGMEWSSFLENSSASAGQEQLKPQPSDANPPPAGESGMSWTSYLADPGSEAAPPTAQPKDEPPKKSSWKDFASE